MMMKKILLVFIFTIFASAASAQTCPTRPVGDSSNSCASTAFVQANISTPTTPFQKFGAKCDGVTNDIVAIQAAINAHPTYHWTSANGVGTAICAISGNLLLPNSTWLQEIVFKQLSPNGSADRRTLLGGGIIGPITLIDIDVDRNGSLSDTTGPSTAAGIYLSGNGGDCSTVTNCISGVYLNRVSVHGNGPGSGIVVTDAIWPQIVNSSVHDMLYSSAVDPCSEWLFGISLVRAAGAIVNNTTVARLGGTIAAGVPSGGCSGNVAISSGSISGTTLTTVGSPAISSSRYLNAANGTIAAGTVITGGSGNTWTVNISQTVASTPMTAGTGSWSAPGVLRYYQSDCGGASGTNVSWSGGFVEDCGEGIDISGSEVRNFHTYSNIVFNRIDSQAWKTGAGSTNITVNYPICYNPGYDCIGAGGDAALQTDNIRVVGARWYNVGSNAYWALQPPAGMIVGNASDAVKPTNVFCDDCSSIDNQSPHTMAYAFRNTTGVQSALTVTNPVISGGTLISTYSAPVNLTQYNTSTGATEIDGAFSVGNYPQQSRFVTIPGTGTILNRYDDNTAATGQIQQNYGITAAGQGNLIYSVYGAGGVLGRQAGYMGLLSTGTWADAINSSTKFSVGVVTAGVNSVPFEASGVLASISVPTTIGAGSSITSSGPGGTMSSGAYATTGTSGATLGFLNGNNTYSGTSAFTGAVTHTGTATETWGSGTRSQTISVSSGSWVSNVIQYNDNSITNIQTFNNYGITAANQGLIYSWQFGTGGTLGAAAGSFGIQSTDTWAAAGSQSSKIVATATTAGVNGSAFTASTTAFVAPGTVNGTGFIATAVAPTVAAAQIGYGSTVVAAGSGNCPTGTVGTKTVAGCIVMNVAGSPVVVPYF